MGLMQLQEPSVTVRLWKPRARMRVEWCRRRCSCLSPRQTSRRTNMGGGMGCEFSCPSSRRTSRRTNMGGRMGCGCSCPSRRTSRYTNMGALARGNPSTGLWLSGRCGERELQIPEGPGIVLDLTYRRSGFGAIRQSISSSTTTPL